MPDYVIHIIVSVIGGLVGAVWAISWLYIHSRQVAQDKRITDLETKQTDTITKDFCETSHKSTWQHLDDLLAPLTAQMAKLANGTVDDLRSRVASLEAQIKMLLKQE